MPSLLPTQRFLLFLALASSAYAYSNNLWWEDFDTFHKWSIIQDPGENGCKAEYDNLNSAPKDSKASALINYEVTKAEFGTVAVMLGLLPGVLQMIGPKFSDLAVLATRRPLLALFLTIGSPCPALDYETTGMESLLVEKPEPFWPTWISQRPWLRRIISLVEYFAVMCAAGNVVYQFYRLTFYATVMISTQLGQYGGTLEAFAPLLWVFLGIPIHGLGMLQLHWCRAPREDSSSTKSQNKTTLGSLLHNEITPCAFATDIDPNDAIKLQNGFIYQALNWLIKLCIWADVIYGIIVLSTILFVPMWSAIWMIGLIFTGTLLCRLVLAFEIHGMREVPRTRQKAYLGSGSAGYEMAPLVSGSGKVLQEHSLPLSHR
ncbi:hypothetical protein SLS60_000233 [Paraconiothyrium brasiliense]|uniref:Uncharacterized protein n=1 Tax=Paraconiothyrium brasiliense TaxID=300254 RepID=A0ABR3S5M7_9PLEO